MHFSNRHTKPLPLWYSSRRQSFSSSFASRICLVFCRTRMGLTSGHGRDRSMLRRSQLRETISHSVKRAKPVSPRASLVDTPANKRKRMMVSVELPNLQSSQISRPKHATPATPNCRTQVIGQNEPEDSHRLSRDFFLPEILPLDLPMGHEPGNLQGRRRQVAES